MRRGGSTAPLLLAVATLSSCLPAVRGRISERDWIDGPLRQQPLSLSRQLDDLGRLESVELNGTIHVYRTWREYGSNDEIPLPAHRELAILIDSRFHRQSSSPRADSTLTLRFRKLSQIYAGPRVEDGASLSLTAGPTRRKFEIETGFQRDASYFDVAAKALVPLSDLESLLAGDKVSGRLGPLEPFELSASQIAVLRSFVSDVKTLGDLDNFDRRGEPEDGIEELAPRRRWKRAWVPPAGIIWGTRYERDSELDRSLVTLVVTYPGPRASEVDIPATSWFEYPEATSPHPRVARMIGREGSTALRGPDPSREDEVTSSSLAAIVTRAVRSAFALELLPEVHTFLFPLESFRGCRFALRTPLGRGVAIGIPSVEGRIDERHASTFAWLLTHELTEGLLMFPYLGADCRLYGRDRRNRWIGDGAAEFLSTRVCKRARRDGFELPPPHNDVLRIRAALERGREAISLADWQVVLTHNDASQREVRRSVSEQDSRVRFLRYVAAEYLFATWHEAASARAGTDAFPMLVSRVRANPEGPTYPELTSWLAKTSGLDIGSLADSVDLSKVLHYHIGKWQTLGWPLPASTTAIR